MTQEAQTEVVKLGTGMSDEERAELESVLAEAKANADDQQEPEGEAEAEAPEAEAKAPPCKLCGFTEGQQQPLEEDVQEFMRATLGSTRFTKTYSLMRGNIEVTYATIDTKAAERMNSVISEFKDIDDVHVFQARVSKLQMIYMLQSYNIGDKEVGFEPSDAKTPDKAEEVFLERFGHLDEQVIGLFTRVLNSFIGLKVSLSKACFDENFYAGAGPF